VPRHITSDKVFVAAFGSNANAVGRRLRKLEARRRTVVFNAGDPPSGIYVVESGGVKLCLPTTGRGEKVIALLGPGETFGLSAALANKPHVVTAIAARDCMLLHLPQSSAVNAMRRDPKFLRQVAAQLNCRFRRLLADIQMTARQSAIQRTVAFLLDQISDTKGREPIAMRLPAKKGDIASKLDLTGAHFSRILRELDSAGLVKLEGSTVTIKRVASLRNFTDRPRKRTRPR
jgi:CRP-like cAMP-binding protein